MFADRLPVPGGIGLSDQDPAARLAENRHWMRHGRYIPDCGDCEDLRKLRERADKLLGNYLSEQKLLAETITRAEKAEADLARLREALQLLEDCANPGKNGVCDACHDVAKAALAGAEGGTTAQAPAKESGRADGAPAKPAKAEPCSYCGRFHCGYAQSTASPSRGA